MRVSGTEFRIFHKMTIKEHRKIIKMILTTTSSLRPIVPFDSFSHGYVTCIGDIVKKLEKMHEDKTISE